MSRNYGPNRRVRLARHLRDHATSSEIAVWSIIRRKQIFGLRFRRQHLVGRFVVDFYCPEIKLALELEGGVHSGRYQIERDQERARLLEKYGLTVLRISNADATEENLRRILWKHLPAHRREEIHRSLFNEAGPWKSSPSPEGGGARGGASPSPGGGGDRGGE